MKCPYCGRELERKLLPWKTQIESRRLYLRRFSPSDGQGLYNYLSDPQVVKYEPYETMDERQCEQAAERLAQSPDFWAVCLKEGGELAGQIYLSEREQQSWELGYVFSARHQRKGCATEAVTALLDELFQMAQPHRVTASCNPENQRSWRLLERIGFRREGHLKCNVAFSSSTGGAPQWQDTYLYGLLREDWSARR